MPGFFKIDIEDFDEIWTDKQNSDLFPIYALLCRDAWRQPNSKCVRQSHYEITLRQNQLILHTRMIARVLDLPASTLRDRLRRLEALEAIKTDEPVPRIKIVTTLLAYTYGPNGERTPCVYRTPSVVDLQADRDETENVSPQESEKKHPNNDLQRSYTEDYRLVDSENQNRLVRSRGTRGRDLHDDIPELAAIIREKTPDLTEEQANEEAEALLLYEDSELCPLD